MKRGWVIHHNGPWVYNLKESDPHSKCIEFWKGIRAYQMKPVSQGGRGWSDVSYSFMVCPHGLPLEGRGWNKNQFANGTDQVGEYDGKDSEWYTVFVPLGWIEATGQEQEPNPKMVQGVARLINEGRSTKRCGLRVLPHNRFKIKRCPGRTFTLLANSWDNRLIVIGAVPEEDEMNAAQMAELKAHIDGRLIRMMSWMTTGKGNAWINPNLKGMEFTDDAGTITLNEVWKEVQGDELNEAAIVSGILAGFPAEAIATAIPSDMAEEVARHLMESDLSLRIEPKEASDAGSNS